ncbi:MAG: hypothetical protein H7Y30_00510, partial [Pyrinomonadaceae bacterium]|nr:hypothetical protein [Pyrinomonadaceae bacterium]
MRKQSRRRVEQRSSPSEAKPTLEVLIERILPGGAGLAHAGGQTILVGL